MGGDRHQLLRWCDLLQHEVWVCRHWALSGRRATRPGPGGTADGAGVVERTHRRAGLGKQQLMTLGEKQRSQAGA